METLIALEDDKITLPSVVFFNLEERRPVYGRLALAEYLEGYEGRLMRSLKSLLGSKLLKSETTVLGSAMPFKDILGLFLGTLKQRAEEQASRSFEEVVLGRPEIGRAHVCTPVTNSHLVCRLLLEKKKNT